MDNLEISTDNSDIEDDSNFHSANTFIQPSVDANNKNNNINSGDENYWGYKYLSVNHLLRSAVLEINTLYGQTTSGD